MTFLDRYVFTISSTQPSLLPSRMLELSSSVENTGIRNSRSSPMRSRISISKRNGLAQQEILERQESVSLFDRYVGKVERKTDSKLTYSIGQKMEIPRCKTSARHLLSSPIEGLMTFRSGARKSASYQSR